MNREIWNDNMDPDELDLSTKDVAFDARAFAASGAGDLEIGWMKRKAPVGDAQLASWAKEQGPRTRHTSTGRPAGAVTGLPSKGSGSSSRTRSSRDMPPLPKRVTKTPSILSTVSDKQHGFGR